jgi:hypothetical protein
VTNRAGGAAVALHAVRSPRGAQGDWGGNLLRPDRPLNDGGGFRVLPAAEAGCRFDLRLVLGDGREAILRDQDICVNREVPIVNAATPGAIARPAAPRPPASAPQAGPARPDVPLAVPNAQARTVSTGTGFLVANERVMTNHHVIDNCNRVLLRTPTGHWLAAAPPRGWMPRSTSPCSTCPGSPDRPGLPHGPGDPARRGRGGLWLPLAGLLSSDPKLTRGEVNGLRGLGDNPNQFQISAECSPAIPAARWWTSRAMWSAWWCPS